MPYSDYNDQLEYNRRYNEETGYQRKWKQQYRENNREKYNAYMKSYRAATKYGLSVEEYDEIISRGCQICGTKEGKLCVDHCHTSENVRGCLCSRCNLVLGQIQDSTEWLRNALNYLE